MSCVPNYLKLEGLNHISESGHTTQLETNLKLFLDWAFLGAGGWFNTSLGNSDAGVYGGDFSQLREVKDPSIGAGRVWESARKDWVWESGQIYTDKTNTQREPIQISGVYLNGVIQPSGYYIDYPNGRVVFDTPNSGPVEVEYSYRYIQVYCASQTPWFNQLQFGSFRIDQGGFQLIGSGEWNNMAEARVQMPAVVIEIVKNRTFTPYEMGNIAHRSHQDILFHVIAETSYERDLLTDALSPQENKVIWLFDINEVLSSGLYPLNEYGSKVNNLTYKDFVSDDAFRWNKCYIEKASTQDITSPDPKLFRSVVKWTVETIQGNR